MDLWIRSQDRETLERVTYLSIGGVDKNKILADDCCSIGEYKSKERALEVLDEIQNHILNLGETVLIYGKEYKEYGRVYEMPEE